MRAAAASSHSTVRVVSSGITWSASNEGTRQTRTASITTLRVTRSAREMACFRVTAQDYLGGGDS